MMMGKPLQMNRFVRLSTVGSFASLYLYILIVQTNKMSSTLVAVSHGDASPSGWGWPTRQDSRYADSSALPTWLSEYFDWHNRMRHKYPGDKILTDPKAPGVIIKNCAYKCGGLHDRLGHLGWDLLLANQTRRILLIHWCTPAPIEHFLVPNKVDWTLPRSSFLDDRLFSNTTKVHIHCDRAVEEWTMLFDGYVEYIQGDAFFTEHVDIAIDRATKGDLKDKKILRYKVLGDDFKLKQRLMERHNESDPISWSDSFSSAFWTLFKPSEGLQRALGDAFKELQLSIPADYNAPPFYALHVRVRHPRGHVGVAIEAKGGAGGARGVDKFGLEFRDEAKTFAVGVAEHALQCARKMHLQKHSFFSETYIFYADSEELVDYVGQNYQSKGIRVQNMTGTVLHIDRQHGHPPDSYYSAFIDLFVAAHADCIVFGAGNYALLAGKINVRGARKCMIRHHPDDAHDRIVHIQFLECNNNDDLDISPKAFDRQLPPLPLFESKFK